MSREQAGSGAKPDTSGEAADEQEASTGRRTRGGSSYQHSLSARGIKSSGRARSCSDEDLLTSMERLERATRLPSFEDEDEPRDDKRRAYGRRTGGGTSAKASAGGIEQRVRGPRFDW